MREPAPEAREERREEVDADGRARADGQAAALEPLELGHRALGLVGEREDPPGVAGEQVAGGRQADPLRQPVDERRAHGLLEEFQLPGDGRLGDAQAHAGPGDAALARDGVEDAEVVQVHDMTL